MPAKVPLALLATLQALDEVDPDWRPARQKLGGLDIVRRQMRRYEEDGGPVPADEVAGLLRLIARRADAERAFQAAGTRIAAARSVAGLLRRAAARVLPERARWWRVRSLTRRWAEKLCPGAWIEVDARESVLRVEGGLPARATENGTGCSVVTGLIEELLRAYRVGTGTVAHQRCEARSHRRCEWMLDGGGGGVVSGGSGDRG